MPDGTEVLSYTIITTAPNDFSARLHDRMPVVLDERDYGRWLESSERPQDLLKACHNEALINYPVSRQVNSVENNDASLLVPLVPKAGQRHRRPRDVTHTVYADGS